LNHQWNSTDFHGVRTQKKKSWLFSFFFSFHLFMFITLAPVTFCMKDLHALLLLLSNSVSSELGCSGMHWGFRMIHFQIFLTLNSFSLPSQNFKVLITCTRNLRIDENKDSKRLEIAKRGLQTAHASKHSSIKHNCRLFYSPFVFCWLYGQSIPQLIVLSQLSSQPYRTDRWFMKKINLIIVWESICDETRYDGRWSSVYVAIYWLLKQIKTL
jgi:hypothetical protein